MKHIRSSVDGIYILEHSTNPSGISVTDFGETIRHGSLCVDISTDDVYILKNGGDWEPISGISIADDSKQYLNIENGELSIKALSITNVFTDTNYGTNFNEWYSSHYENLNNSSGPIEEGDMLILTDISSVTEVWLNNGGTSGTPVDYTQIQQPTNLVYTTNLDDSIESPGWTIPNGLTVGDVKGQTFSQFIDNYLFPTVLSTLTTNRSTTLTFTPSAGTVEVGTLLDPTLTANFNRGLITGGDGDTTPLVGLPNTFTFTGVGISTSVIVNSTNTTEQIVTDGSNFVATPASFGNNNWSVQVSYDEGVTPYYDSKGNLDTSLDGSRVAGNVSDASPNYTGRYYAFYDTGSIPVNSAQVRAASNKTFLNSGNNGSFNITIPSSTADVYFAIPNDGQTVTVLYVESSNADVTGSFSVSTFNVNDANGSPVSYDIYSTTIGGGGYPATATYAVTIS